MSDPKKITVGTFRPMYDEVLKTKPAECSCGQKFCSSAGVYVNLIRSHWQEGHFDKPVYQEVGPAFPKVIMNAAARLKYVYDKGLDYEDRVEATEDFLYELVSWIMDEKKERENSSPAEEEEDDAT